jgi:hypothetical protein
MSYYNFNIVNGCSLNMEIILSIDSTVILTGRLANNISSR